MGLFFSSKKSSVTPSNVSQAHHTDQHGSMSGEINHAELRQGIGREIHRAFQPTERKTIEAMLDMEMDKSSSNRRHVIDRGEVKSIVDNVHKIYPQHSEKLREILEKRME